MVSDKSVGFSTVARIRSGRLKPLREGEAWKFFSSQPKLPCSMPHSFHLVVLLASGDESNSSSAYRVGRAPGVSPHPLQLALTRHAGLRPNRIRFIIV